MRDLVAKVRTTIHDPRQPMLFPIHSFLSAPRTALSLFAVLALLLMAASAPALEALPPKPDTLLFDDARLFSAEDAAKLSARLKACADQTGVRLYVAAFTLLQRPSVQQQARDLINPWMGDEAALMLAFHRGSNQSIVVMSPEMWRRYPAGDLVTTFDASARALVSKDEVDHSKRVLNGANILIDALMKLEAERRMRNRILTHDDTVLAAVFGGALAVVVLVMLLVRRRLRHHEKQLAVQYEFPQVEVAMRLGAPMGGGVIAEASADS